MRILLLKGTEGTVKVLDTAIIPTIDTLEDLPSVVAVVGKLLTPYVDSLSDPNIVSSSINTSIEDWTIRDLESIEYLLSRDDYRLLILNSDEDAESDLEKLNEETTCYAIIDKSVLHLGVFPKITTLLKPRNDEGGINDFVELYKDLLEPYNYFDQSKFLSDPIGSALSDLEETRNALGAVNQPAMFRLYEALGKLNKELIVFDVL